VRAVLFDLDDTLFDHRHCTEASLDAIWRGHECFRAAPFAELERAHGTLLEELHRDVMLGRIDVDSARVERFRRLFRSAGVEASDTLARDTASEYRRAYVSARRPIAGAAALLARVRERAAVVVVSNNVLVEQQEKLRHCGLDALVDALVAAGDEETIRARVQAHLDAGATQVAIQPLEESDPFGRESLRHLAPVLLS
jgi:putative hydrolase of the HAD superfamily